MMFAGSSFEMIERFVRLAVYNMCAVCRPPLPSVSLWQCGLLDNANNYIYYYGFHIIFGGGSVAVAVESRSFSRTMHRIDQWKSAVARLKEQRAPEKSTHSVESSENGKERK